MILLLLALSLLLILATARRALEPECPNCAGKSWGAHSTQLQCSGCGWGGAVIQAAPALPEPQYEICFTA